MAIAFKRQGCGNLGNRQTKNVERPVSGFALAARGAAVGPLPVSPCSDHTPLE